MRHLDLVLIWLLVALGIAHTACTPVFYPGRSLEALWFAGTGLAFVFLGLLHLIRRASTARRSALIAFAASCLGTAFSALLAFKLRGAPQAYVAVLLNAGLAFTTLASRK